MELNIPYSTLLCAFYLLAVSLGRKLQTLLIDMCLYLSAKEGYFCVYPHVHNYVHCNHAFYTCSVATMHAVQSPCYIYMYMQCFPQDKQKGGGGFSSCTECEIVSGDLHTPFKV